MKVGVAALGIERMTFIDINGNNDSLDDVLIACLSSGMFQPEYAAKLSEYSVGGSALLRNPYGALIVKVNDIASQLKLPLHYMDYGRADDDRDAFIDVTNDYLNDLRREYPAYFERQRKIMDEIASYSTALDMLSHVNVSDINFDNIWNNQFLKIRFGRIPSAGMQKLEAYEDKPYELYILDASAGHVWCLYFTADAYKDEIDKMFVTLGFERLRVPDYVHGTPAEAMANISESLQSERMKLESASEEINGFVKKEEEKFLRTYSRIKFLHDAYDLRRFAVTIRDHFHLIGFIQAKDKEGFLDLFRSIPNVNVQADPEGQKKRLPLPVKLKNNWFTRPFEMFVNMYGAPSYDDIDPTPFLAYTYTLLFGIMFGDLGHGLCVAVLGWILWQKRKMALGPIMTRIGISSMFFGFWYGSIFGFEHLLDPVFVNLMGLPAKPIEVLHPDTTSKILVVAIALGAVSIISAIIFNMIIGYKQRNFERMLISSNGLCGLVFYGSVLFGAIMMVQGNNVFTLPYILGFIALPLMLIFFREPIARYANFVKKDTMISHDTELAANTLLDQEDANIPELFGSPFMTARFGRIPTDSYRKLAFYTNEPFMLYPVKIDTEYIWLIYATAIANKAEIDAIFHDLYFERIFIPDDDLKTTEDAREFIKKCVEVGAPPKEAHIPEKYATVAAAKRRSTYERLFPDGFGSFFTETFFEMFEVILSFISNTMSFLRVGGFVLVHAGMMSVVMTLSNMVNSGTASIVIIIIGNSFVMLIEGLIVGIQVLRLEFYELFSRFYGTNGDLFAPAAVRYETGQT